MKKRLVILFTLVPALTVFYLLVGFAGSITTFPPVEGGADAIVVLTGGKGRVEEGLMMLRSGTSPVLILSGVNEEADHDAIFLNSLGDGERERIVLEKRSKSTYENALEVRRLFDEAGFESMVLITSSYHMKRAYYTFRNVMPREVTITPYTVSTPNFDEKRWWANLDLLIPEFMKYCWYEMYFTAEDLMA